VKTRFWPLLEPVTAASVDAVTFLKASTGCSLPLRGTTPGETPDPRVGRWRRVDVVPLLRASILEVNPVRGTSVDAGAAAPDG
jgi:hypothetical protein